MTHHHDDYRILQEAEVVLDEEWAPRSSRLPQRNARLDEVNRDGVNNERDRGPDSAHVRKAEIVEEQRGNEEWENKASNAGTCMHVRTGRTVSEGSKGDYRTF